VGGEEDVGLGVGGGEGEDVEDVGGDDVGGEEVDLGGAVGGAVVVEVAFVGVAALEDGAFHLYAQKVSVVVPSVAVCSLRAGDDEVVGGAVSAGAGEDESEFGGAELEAEFGPFSAAFGVRDVGAFGHRVLERKTAPEGAFFGVAVVVCLKAYPDTNLCWNLRTNFVDTNFVRHKEKEKAGSSR